MSVVVPCHNCADTLGEQLAALVDQDYTGRYEVIVVDNRSTDHLSDTVAQFAESVPGLRVETASEHQSAAYARNVGTRHARYDIVLFCDADDVVSRHWITALAYTLANTAVAAGPLDRTQVNSRDVVDARGATVPGVANRFSFLPHGPGGNLGVWKEVHDAIGGFDETIEIGEDTDYFWRAQLSGFELAESPEAWVYNRLPDGFSATFSQAKGWGRGLIGLHRRYRSRGLAFPSAVSVVKGWIRLLAMLPTVGNPTNRLRFAWKFGWQVGQLQGLLRYPGRGVVAVNDE